MSREESPVVRAVSEEEDYAWIHRAFLASFQTYGVLTVDAMKSKLAIIMTVHNPERPCSAADITQPQLTDAVQTINAKLEPFEFEIRSTRDQHTKDTIYALVNNTSDSLTQLATKFSPSEIAYIRRLLDHMFDTNNTPTREVMALKHADASQLARPSRRTRPSHISSDAGSPSQAGPPPDVGISITEADDVLDALVHAAFFRKSPTGYFSLAPRALMELRAYLKQTYNEAADEADDGVARVRIRDCEGCREVVTQGLRCNRRACEVRWHDGCASSYFRGRARGARACPGCGEECMGDVYVGERADRGGGRASTGGRRATHGQGDEEEED